MRFDDRIHQSGGPRVKALPPLFYALFTGGYFTYIRILALAPRDLAGRFPVKPNSLVKQIQDEEKLQGFEFPESAEHTVQDNVPIHS